MERYAMIRFMRRIQLAPWLRLNISKGGPSLSIGPRGLGVTIGRRPSIHAGIPGTGLSVVQPVRLGTANPGRYSRKAWIAAWTVVALCVAVLYALGS